MAPLFGENSLSYEYDRWSVSLVHRFQGAMAFDQMAVTERGKIEIYALDTQGLPYAPSWQIWNLVGQWEFTEWGQLFLEGKPQRSALSAVWFRYFSSRSQYSNWIKSAFLTLSNLVKYFFPRSKPKN